VKEVDRSKMEAFQTRHSEPYIELELAEMLNAADCPNIPRCFDSFADDKNYYIVSEYANGGDLLNYLMSQDNFPTDEDGARPIIKQVAKGLQALHERNIIHRDVKPANVLVNSQNGKAPVFQLTDFGAAVKLAGPGAKATLRIGTMGFLSPELIQKKPYGCASDIFSLGTLMYFLLTGQIAFEHAR